LRRTYFSSRFINACFGSLTPHLQSYIGASHQNFANIITNPRQFAVRSQKQRKILLQLS